MNDKRLIRRAREVATGKEDTVGFLLSDLADALEAKRPDSEKVQAFMDKFDLFPETVDREHVDFRVSCLDEEMRELKVALRNGDQVGFIDALCDLTYFAIGTALVCGYDYPRHFDAVAQANLDKTRGTKKGRENSAGVDVVKPAGWIGPEIRHEAIIASGQTVSGV